MLVCFVCWFVQFRFILIKTLSSWTNGLWMNLKSISYLFMSL